ncbi:smad nuclear interacting protein 1-like [Saccostrea echinata]|uniref:smad nuclear interacting protein 1-like n=1 Tax=Saccostrea echinata TaxID=191078 RepID=UPI002A824DFF|nr:smad nuclear interacting protein 1-like [Saccostrea echinata]
MPKRHKSRSLSPVRLKSTRRRSGSPQTKIKKEPPWTPPRDKRGADRHRERSAERELARDKHHIKRERGNRDYREDRQTDRVRVKQERENRHDRAHRQREDQQRERRRNDDRRRENQRHGTNNPFRNTGEDGHEYGRPGDTRDKNNTNPVEKEKPNFSTSGKLAEDTNVYRGVVIKYNQPPEARKPKTRWRLYPFKGDEALPVLHIHRQSAYLIGRDRIVVDIPVDHPSCSKQHAVLQFRLVEFTRSDGSTGRRVRPYIIDLGSANGTFVNNNQIEAQRFVELMEKDMIKFGFSSREYVILHEKSDTSEVEDQGVISD